MKKLLLTLAVGALGAAGWLMTPADASDVYGCTSTVSEAFGIPDTGAGDVCFGVNDEGTGHVYADGSEGNPDPIDGYISVANDGELDEEGAAIEDDDETPACNDALPGAVVSQIPAP